MNRLTIGTSLFSKEAYLAIEAFLQFVNTNRHNSQLEVIRDVSIWPSAVFSVYRDIDNEVKITLRGGLAMAENAENASANRIILMKKTFGEDMISFAKDRILQKKLEAERMRGFGIASVESDKTIRFLLPANGLSNEECIQLFSRNDASVATASEKRQKLIVPKIHCERILVEVKMTDLLFVGKLLLDDRSRDKKAYAKFVGKQADPFVVSYRQAVIQSIRKLSNTFGENLEAEEKSFNDMMQAINDEHEQKMQKMKDYYKNDFRKLLEKFDKDFTNREAL